MKMASITINFTDEEKKFAENLAEFDGAVAFDAGVGRFAPNIALCKGFYDCLTKNISEVKNQMIHAQPTGHAAGILNILQRAAGAAAAQANILVGIKL